MIDFNKISINQIIYVSQIINESSLYQQEFIEAKYSRAMPNYPTTIEFLGMLNLIEINKDTIRDCSISKFCGGILSKVYAIKRYVNILEVI